MVRAKFTCVTVKSNDGQAPDLLGYEVLLHPVTGGSEENKSFYKWTPGGSIALSTINPEAAAQFEEGKTYYIDFTPAD